MFILLALVSICTAAVDQAALDELPDAPQVVHIPDSFNAIFARDTDDACEVFLGHFAALNHDRFCQQRIPGSTDSPRRAVKSWNALEVTRHPVQPEDVNFIRHRCRIINSFRNCPLWLLYEGLHNRQFLMQCMPPTTQPDFANWEVEEERKAKCVVPKKIEEPEQPNKVVPPPTVKVVGKAKPSFGKVFKLAGSAMNCFDAGSSS